MNFRQLEAFRATMCSGMDKLKNTAEAVQQLREVPIAATALAEALIEQLNIRA